MNVKVFSLITGVVISLLVSCSDSSKPKDTSPTTEMQQTSEESNTALENKSTPMLPVFSIQDVSGKALNLQSFKGKKVFVNLWASWCPPCRREMPSIEKLALSIDTSKVIFVMLSLDDNFDKARAFIKKQKLQLPIYYPAENLPALFNVQSIPSTFIFDEKGELLQRIDGGDDFNTEVYRALLQ